MVLTQEAGKPAQMIRLIDENTGAVLGELKSMNAVAGWCAFAGRCEVSRKMIHGLLVITCGVVDTSKPTSPRLR